MTMPIDDRGHASESSPPSASRAIARRWPRIRVGTLLLLAGVVTCVGLKLWLVATYEMVARASSLDQLRFAQMASALIDGRWLGDYDYLTLIRQPVFPLWIWLAHESGIPLRIANEILLAGGALAFAAALRRVGVGNGTVMACFATIVLQPMSFVWNGELRAETLYSPVLLVALAALIRLATAPRLRTCAAWAAVAGIPLALLWHMRPESVLVAILVVQFVGMEAWRWKRKDRTWSWVAARAACIATPIALAVSALGFALASRNAVQYGVAVVSDEAAPGYVALERALLRIRPARSTRYVAVPADARRRAYEASPTFRELEPWLEGDLGGKWKTFFRVATHAEDELGDAWLFWAIREAAASAGHYRTAADAERYYAAAAAEIDAACDAGRIAARPVLLTSVNPDPATFVAHLPASLLRVLVRFVRVAATPARDDPGASPDVRALFTKVANRRPALTTMSAVRVRGWASHPADPVVSVVARSAEGDEIARVPTTSPNGAAESRSFCLEVERDAGAVARLSFHQASGSETDVALAERQETIGALTYRVDYLCERSLAARMRRAVLRALAHVQPALVLIAGAAACVALAALYRRRRAVDGTQPIYAASALIAGVVLARVLLLALLDASSFDAAHSRYVYPVASLAVCGMLVVVSAALSDPER
ncbi:MAG: hypothetical protein HYR85_05825 [Planctomycetes bacterium]|nr:hypothetical protein [Planctomycetota bacterium]